MLSFVLASMLAALELEHGKRPFVFIFPSVYTVHPSSVRAIVS